MTVVDRPSIEFVVHRGCPLSEASVAVIAVHGRDQDPGYLIEHLVSPIEQTLPVDVRPVVSWLLPRSEGRSWYPGRYRDPLEANQPQLDCSLDRLADVRSEVGECGLGPEQVMWVGFSQGACLVLEYVLRRPEPWGGVVSLTGAVLGPGAVSRSVAGDLTGVPIYFGVGERDPWMTLDGAEDAARLFAAAGAATTVEVFDSDHHEIRPAEIAAVAGMIRSLPTPTPRR